MKPARVHLVSNRELKSISSVDTEAKSNNLPPLVRKNQVAPAKTASPFARSHSTPNLHFWVGFQSAFGAFGLALVLIVFISISWTTWLIVLAIAPNATANYLMDTSELDDGNFWLIVDPDNKLKIASIIGLAIVDVFYLFILFKLVLWRKTEFYDERSSTMKHHGPAIFIRAYFDRIKASWGNIVGIRGNMNISFCLRFITVINLMVETAATQDTRETTWKTLSQSFHQQRVSRWVAVVFVAFGAAVVIFTHKSISDSEAACAPYPECVVHAYKWGTANLCPCRTVVDVFRAPRTFQDWTQPVDVSDKVEVLSRAGMLQNLQLLNRALTRWPEELRKCDDLQYMYVVFDSYKSLTISSNVVL
ncbi:unnamed protein product [Phytophthora lilii]|uniref:Unnamed protein product n=1 Tax=Phytophthora lilii TaxID=2077276 RepID=A0A9W7CU92_9STRA|nr:unnamed protein product [Phytophthora lilii]